MRHRLGVGQALAAGAALLGAASCAAAAAEQAGAAEAGPTWHGFARSGWPSEQVRYEELEPGVRLIINAPAPEHIDPERTNRIVLFATPNGNTIEQTLGCAAAEGLDWHYDIQHIAAQTRRQRTLTRGENIVLVCLEAEGLSWPAWRAKHPDNAQLIHDVVRRVSGLIPLDEPRLTLSCHSGGGSFLFGFINGAAAIADDVDRLIWLDANYGYSDDEKHGEKLLTWLRGDSARRLIVMAYDDREITYNGKRVVGPTGGTYRATHRMMDFFGGEGELRESAVADFRMWTLLEKGDGEGAQVRLLIHPNPENIILHTRLVGEMNGQLFASIVNTPAAAAIDPAQLLAGPRAYEAWVQARPYAREELAAAQAAGACVAARIPARPAGAPGGRAFMESIASLQPAEREKAILAEVLRGNVPSHLRRFVPVPLTGAARDGRALTGTAYAMPDYLAIGDDADFVRVPMTPKTAQAIANGFGCTLPTRALVNAIHAHASETLEPIPLTEAREAVATFVRHHDLIETERVEALSAGKDGQEPVPAVISGIKKDIVLTNRLEEKPDRVAIYGWHHKSGEPIQPLTIVHQSSYVDYSHGVRLIGRWVEVDGRLVDFAELAADTSRCALVSDEGVLSVTSY